MKNRYDRLRWIPCVIIMSFLISCGGGSSSTSESTSSSINNDTNTPQTPSDTSPTKTYTSGEIAMMQQGKSIYELQCQSCHGEKGTGGTGGALTHSYDLNKLVEKITASMPTFGEKCTGSCAANVGLWIFEGFPEIKNEGATSDPTKPDPIESEPEEEKPLSPELQKGKEYWDAQCLSCHGTDGVGAIPILSCETKSRCANQATLQSYIANSMPPGSKKTCASSECSSLTARYILEVLFNHDQEGDSPYALENIQVKTWPETLYKTSINLIGRLPTAQEKSNAATESGYEAVINDYMNTPEFYTRLKDIFNDTYLVRGASDVADTLNTTNFPSARWYDNDAIVATLSLNADIGRAKGMAKALTEQALREEALELIKYIAENNRPMTELLTANYTMANRYSARTYGVHDSITWTNTDIKDDKEFKPVTLTLTGYGHSGLLTSFPFWIKYPDTNTNLNRHRARYIFDFFLDQDVMLLGTRLSDPNASTGVNPTINNPECSICHDVIDPVSNLLFNFMPVARFNPTAPHKTLTDPRFAMKAPGLLDAVWVTGNKQQWLGTEITTKHQLKFAKSMVRTVYKGVTGHSLMEAGIPRQGSHLTAFVKQEEVVEALANSFIQSNFNVKSLVLNVSKMIYYRAKGLSNIVGDTSAYLESSSGRPLSPEMLNSKMISALGFKWTGNMAGTGVEKALDRGGNGYFSYLGGIDSVNTTERAKESNSLMLSAHKRLAMEMSCLSAARDFYLPLSSRNLLTKVERTTVPFDAMGNAISANQTLIRQNIVFLFEKLHGVSLSPNHQDVTDALNVFNSTYQKGQEKIKAAGSNMTLANSLKNLPAMCQVTRDLATNTVNLSTAERITVDDNYVIRSWMAVLYYLLGDSFYNYE